MKIIIAGAHAIGAHLAKLLARGSQDIVLIDDSAERLEAVSADYDLMTIHASPSSISALREAGAQHADLFIAVTLNEDLNMNACGLAKAMGAKKTMAKVGNNEFLDKRWHALMQAVGVDAFVNPEELAAHDIVSSLKMSWVRQRWDVRGGALTMLGVKLRENCELLNRPLKDICKPETPYHIVAIKRQGETIIPRGDDQLQVYDLVYFMTTRNHITYVRRAVGKEHYPDVNNVMIMGGGETAVKTARLLPQYINAKIFETDPQRCEDINELVATDNVMVINGDGRDIPLLVEESIKNTQAFVALTGNAETNILACLTAKRLGVSKTIAMVDNTDYVAMAVSLDIGAVVNRKAIAASHIYQTLLDQHMKNTRFLTTANADVVEFTAQPNAKITKKRICDLGLPTGMTIGGLVRNGEGMLVSGGTQVQAGDVVVVFCHDISMVKVEKYFN